VLDRAALRIKSASVAAGDLRELDEDAVKTIHPNASRYLVIVERGATKKTCACGLGPVATEASYLGGYDRRKQTQSFVGCQGR